MGVEENSTSPSTKKEGDSVVTENTTTETQEMDTGSSSTSAEQPTLIIRDSDKRPVVRLSVKLIETYKHINKIYYEAKAKKLREQKDGTRGGVHNDGYDDQHYDYVIHGDEIFAERYIIKHRIGKGSFGQVVCAYDRQQQCDVAIKIIKSKHAFMVQAQTEIRLLELTLQKDDNDSQNVVRLLDTFVYRKHQCLVFEMLSYNLYELLKNTKFRGVSLALVRKFAKQILRGLEFLSRPDVDIIHCDLKPENILLRHPKRSAIKIIDFGSSCLTTKKMYTYIQSRFYRSPEVLLGLPYSQKIDMWSLGCVLVEMHTGEPLFGGVDQLDQMNRIVNLMGMVPASMVEASPPETRKIFFSVVDEANPVPPDRENVTVKITDSVTNLPVTLVLKPPKGESNTRKAMMGKTLEDVIGVTTGGPQGRRKDDVGHTVVNYRHFADFIRHMLAYEPEKRVSASDALTHEYLFANIDFPGSNADSSSGNKSGNSTSQSNANTSEPKQTTEKSQKINVGQAATSAPSLVRRRSSSAPRLSSNDFGSSTQTTHTETTNATTSTTATTQETTSSSDQSKVDGDGSVPMTVSDQDQKSEPSVQTKDSDISSTGQQTIVSNSNEGPMETSELDDEGNGMTS
mmetsp:Transcript_20328/g.37723  ORF Transcript_20328/g.37723 Transcript_20328/m.37723 type:complete len:626 (-) Transcript_20328:336-2213(-)